MKPVVWKDVLELFGIAAIVASLIFVGLQLKQSQDIALSELGASILASRAETNSSISDHSDVWLREIRVLISTEAKLPAIGKCCTVYIGGT